MIWLWTWGGRCFGYRDADDLWTYDGRHVSRFAGNSVFDSNGQYVGEVSSERLIARLDRKGLMGPSFAPSGSRPANAKFTDDAGFAMLTGYEDFPKIEG
jgi:hypothetical protein